VKGTYGIGEAMVDLQAVSDLYDSIMVQLKQREMQEIVKKIPKNKAPIKFKNTKRINQSRK
jgi:hypothetical protein